MSQEEKTKVGSSKKNRALSAIVVLAVLLCLAVGIAGYFYYQYKYVATVNGQVDEVASLTKIIGAMIELPEGETPTLATVTDKEKLIGQPFFQKAENGDKVLIYTNTGRAILYRPSTKKIVDVTTVNVNAPVQITPPAEALAIAPQQTTDTTPAVPEVPQSVKIALYNGSAKLGVTNTLEEEIKTKFTDVEIVAKEKAAKSDYSGNLVIDLSGKNAELAKKLAETFGGTVGIVPAGETASQSDILIIVGNK